MHQHRTHFTPGPQPRPALQPDVIPEELRSRPQWVGWRFGATRPSSKRAKLPVDARTGRRIDATSPKAWSPFAVAVENREQFGLDGVGYAFSASDPYFGADLDDSFDPDAGELVQWAGDVATALGTYTEISPSGLGVKLIGRGKLPGHGLHVGQVELYDRVHYFTITGNLLPGAPPEIREASEAATNLYRLLAESRKRPPPPDDHVAAAAYPPSPGDDELIERAGRARNGAKFLRLWSGDWSGYPSQSEADLALCSLLAFWCGPDPGRVVALFRRSGLMRGKWRRADYSLRLTAALAVRSRSVYWSAPAPVSRPAPGLRPVLPSPLHPPCVSNCVHKQTGEKKGRFVLALREAEAAHAAGDLGRLEEICAALQRQAGAAPFFLSVRKAARALGVGKTWAAQLLKQLAGGGGMLLVEKGTRKTMRASEYRYVGPSFEDLAEEDAS